MAKHKDFTVATDVKVYFCDPQRVPGNAARTKTQNGLLPTILPEEHKPNRLFPVGSETSSAALKSTPATNFRFSDSCE